MAEQRFTQDDVYAALGMEAPAEQPEIADRAGQNGANEPAPTTPAGAEGQATEETDFSDAVEMTGSEGGSSGGTGDPSPTDGGDGGEIATGQDGPRNDSAPMSKEERARQAAARREREKQDAVRAAVAAEREKLQREHKAELEEVFSRAGMTDRYSDNKPIKTMEDFRAWNAKAQAAGLSRRLQEGKLTAEDLQAAVDNSPAVQEAREAVQRMKQAEEAASRQQFQQVVDNELAEIKKLDPSVSSLNDIINREGGAEFARYVRENNLTFLQAFKLTFGDRLAKAQTMAAAEGRARQQHGKDHMRTSVSGGGITTDVPQRTVEIFRQFNPGMTMDEIRKEYARFTPKTKK